MIELEVTTSPDDLYLGKVKLFHNSISVGSKNYCTLFFPIDKVKANFFELNISEDGILSLEQKNQELEIFVNGKITNNYKRILPNDFIKIDQFEFKINSFVHTPHQSKKDGLNKIVDQLIEEKSPIIDVIQNI